MKKIHQINSLLKDKKGIEIPQNIIDLYDQYDKELRDTAFITTLESIAERISNDYEPIEILMSEAFAREVIRLMDLVKEEHGLEHLFQQIKNHEFNKIKNCDLIHEKLINTKTGQPFNEDLEEFVYSEILYTVNDYDFKKNRFNYPLLQQAFENLNSDINLIKCILVLYADCGGLGGIIFKGLKAGHHIDHSYDDPIHDIVHNGKNIEYQGFVNKHCERSSHVEATHGLLNDSKKNS